VKYQRHGFHLTRSEIYRAFDSWWLNGKRLGLRYRCNPDVYRAELLSGVADVQQASWLPKVVNFWMRWTEHPEFPTDKKPYEKLAWVIRQHCAERQVKEFFLSARDAATITGTTFTNANATLHRLVAAGIIKQAGKRKHARHAQNWRLLSPLRERSTPERV
jgi:hypothetical protein